MFYAEHYKEGKGKEPVGKVMSDSWRNSLYKIGLRFLGNDGEVRPEMENSSSAGTGQV